jgi:hypothetical protein
LAGHAISADYSSGIDNADKISVFSNRGVHILSGANKAIKAFAVIKDAPANRSGPSSEVPCERVIYAPCRQNNPGC